MEGTDIYLLDNFGAHDHTYFGNGCPNSTTEGGSTKACSTKLVQTMDGETQEIGSIYNFQAATSGSGSALEEDNTNSPDTFCPLGWQLPYSGTGGDYYNQSRSFAFLFNTYSLISDYSSTTKLRSYPLSYIYPGYYTWNEGKYYFQGTLGIYTTATTKYSSHSYVFNSWNAYIDYLNVYGKASGGELRCVDCFSIHSSTARWQEHQQI